MIVLYLCDKRACEICESPCMHTSDIRHAKNFERGINGGLIEKSDPNLDAIFNQALSYLFGQTDVTEEEDVEV